MSEFVLQGTPYAPTRRIDYARELNQEQLDVVVNGDGACLVLAGAGSGKTRTLTYRVAALLERGVDPASILLLTFTNKAAKEMLSRVGQLVGTDAGRIWGGTFHSVANRILRAFAEHVGHTSRFSILDQEDAGDLFKAVMKEMQIDPKARRFPSASVVQDIVSFARNTQTELLDVVRLKYPHFEPFLEEIGEIARQYQARKKAGNVMDFDDLLTNLVILLDDPVVGGSIADRFQFVLVDEYQDTNALQARIVRGFAAAHKNVLVVGDDAQSIYAFRGADVQNILAFPKQWPGAKILKLLTNYRSTPEILELANESLQHNAHQFKKELQAVCDHGEKPKYVPCASASQEVQFVAEQILQLREQGVGLHAIAVLFRSSSHSQALEFELMKRDIPYEYRGGQKFFERAHIKDVVSCLRIAQNPRDEVAWLRVLGLQQGIGAATASTLVAEIRRQLERVSAAGETRVFTQVLLQDYAVPGRARTGFEEFVRMARTMDEAGSPSEMIRAVAGSTYQDYLEREYPNWRDRLEDLEQLALFAETYTELEPFLADISLYDEIVAGRDRGTTSADRERMVLSTIHQAKGLEWDTVFVIHVAEGSFPSKRALGEGESGMEEERRLFYVAVTRARRRLFLSYPMTMGYDALLFNQPSTFIDEVSPRLFERIEVREAGWGGRGRSGGATAAKRDDWSWDSDGDGWSEPTIDYGISGKPGLPGRGSGTKTAWKSDAGSATKRIPGSFLSNIEDLGNHP